MSLSLYLAFCVYAVVTSVTPGPNNFMVLASGVNFGVLKTLPLVIGICFGFTIMFLLIALFHFSHMLTHCGELLFINHITSCLVVVLS